MAGKRLGQRDKEAVTVPLHANDPVGPHIHPMTSAVRLASSYPACEFVHPITLKSTQGEAPPLKLGSQEFGNT